MSEAAKHSTLKKLCGLTNGSYSAHLRESAIANGINPVGKSNDTILLEWLLTRFDTTETTLANVKNDYATTYGATNWDSLDTLLPSCPFGINKTLGFYHDANTASTIIDSPGSLFAITDRGDNGVSPFTTTGGTFPSYSATSFNSEYPGITFGANDFLAYPDISALDYASTGMCLIAALQVTQLPSTFKNLIGKSTTTNQIEFVLQLSSAGVLDLRISPDGTNGSLVILNPGYTVILNRPFVVEIDFNIASTVVRINGNLYAYSATSIFNGTSPIVYGDATKDGTFVLNECALFTQSLTATERLQIREGLRKKLAISVSSPEIVPTYLSAGQSNELGLASNAEAPANLTSGPITNCYIYNVPAGATQQLQIGVNNQANDASSFGPEMESGRLLAETWGKRTLLVKQALSGAHLANDDLSNSFYPTTGSQWTALITRLLAAFAYERSQGRECEIYCTFWFQGEADMIGVTSGGTPYLNSYQANLDLLIDTLRSIYSLRGFGRSNSRFVSILSAVNISPYTTVFNGTAVNKQINVSTIAACDANDNAQSLSIEDIATFNVDNLHLNAQSQVKVGNRRALIALSSFAPFITFSAKPRNFIKIAQ